MSSGISTPSSAPRKRPEPRPGPKPPPLWRRARSGELKPLALEKARFLVEPPPRPTQANRWTPAPWGAKTCASSSQPIPASHQALGQNRLWRRVEPHAPGPAHGFLGGRGPQTLIFDEVDAGIGGKPARRVGKRLRDLGPTTKCSASLTCPKSPPSPTIM